MAESLRPRSWLLLVAAVALALAVGVVIGARGRASPGIASAQASGPTAGMPGMPGMEPAMPSPPAGASSSAVYIPPARQQLIGVRTGVVERQRVSGNVRTVGVLAYDQTRVAEIHTKVSGWVERLYVDYVGKPVHRGQPLFSVYSPDLATAQADYVIALRARKQLAGAGLGDASSASDALLAAARERLRRWDVSDAEVAALDRSEQPTRTVMLSSPIDGVLLEKTTYLRQ